jgi:hypothetical protein
LNEFGFYASSAATVKWLVQQILDKESAHLVV